MENFNLIKEKENPLFKRKEIKFKVNAEITPNYAEVGKFISEKFSTSLENIKIKNVLGKFGSKEFTILTNIYSSKEDRENTERKSKKDVALVPTTPAPTEEAPEQPVETLKEESPVKAQPEPTQEQPTPTKEEPAEEPKQKETPKENE